MSDHLLLIDSSGFIHRALAAGAQRFRSDGLPTWGILGFASLLWKLIGAAADDKPTLAAAVFDPPGRYFRHTIYPDYKANRGPRSEEIGTQMPFMRHVAHTLGIEPIEVEGYEADDVIATLAWRARKAGIRTTIVSADKDFGQLVEDGIIEIVVPNNGRLREADVEKKFGVPPARVCDFQALRGDDVDNIPGVPGCGDERAAALVRRFGSFEDVIRNADKCRWPMIRAQLKRPENIKAARLSYKLATLRKNVHLPADILSTLKTDYPRISHLKELLALMEAPLQITAIFNLDPSLSRVVDHLDDPMEWWREELMAPGQKIPDMPQCGYYQRKLISGGAYVCARIWRESDVCIDTAEPTGRDVLICEVNGMRRDPHSEWMKLATQPISEEAYHYEKADAAHARRYRPDDPKANPLRAIKRLDHPVVTNPRGKISP